MTDDLPTASGSDTASHTLALLRRFDKRLDQLTEMFIRQQELIGRLDRNMDELRVEMRAGFGRVERDIRELKSDSLLVENALLTRAAEHHETAVRLREHDERLAAIEAALTAKGV